MSILESGLNDHHNNNNDQYDSWEFIKVSIKSMLMQVLVMFKTIYKIATVRMENI